MATSYTFEHAEVRMTRRGPYVYVEVRHRVRTRRGDPKPKPEPWHELGKTQHEPSMAAVQRVLAGTQWSKPKP